jgi:hypothetical protein
LEGQDASSLRHLTRPRCRLTNEFLALAVGCARISESKLDAAKVYRVTGEKDLAREEMQRYLAADPSAKKAAVEQWISLLR